MGPAQGDFIQLTGQPLVFPETFALSRVNFLSVLIEIKACLSGQDLKRLLSAGM
jgi:hypothetical protein